MVPHRILLDGFVIENLVLRVHGRRRGLALWL
jgi:hypothetical protein